MTQTYQYPNAPIVEACIGLVFDNINISHLKNIAAIESANYPNVTEIKDFNNASQLIGLEIVDKEFKQRLKLQTNQFTFSRLNPYPGWHNFQPEAKRLWKLFSNVTDLIQINSLSLRYINRIDLPVLPFNDLGEYLNTLPKFNTSVTGEPNNFFMQLQIPQKDIQADLIITEALIDEPKIKDKLSLILDIDVIKKALASKDNIWELLEQFHDRKNVVFEDSITAKIRGLINNVDNIK